MKKNYVACNLMVDPRQKAVLEETARILKVSTSAIVRGLIDMYGDKYINKLKRHQIQGEVKII